MTTRTKYLGNIFDETGCHLDPDRIQAVAVLKEPKSVKELRSFLGMVNYVRVFIPNMSSLIAPLRELLRKNIV